MRLQDIQNLASGIPSGFVGQKKKWNEVKDPFTIEKVAVLKRDTINEDGEVVTYSKGPKAGEPIPDLQVVLQIKTESDRFIVRTNSRRITSLFSGYVTGAPEDETRFGDEVYSADAPEGKMHFIPYKQKYADGKEGDVCDVIEVD